LLLVALLALLAGCDDPQSRRAAETARLLDADKAFAAASLRDGAPSAFFSVLTEDAIDLPAGSPPAQGRDKIRDGLKGLGSQVLAWTPRQAEVARSLELGWTWGEWQLLESAGSEHVLGHGKYLDIWHRDDAGNWKLAVDMGNEAPPPDVPAPAAPAAPAVPPPPAGPTGSQ
jgi:ketosteroid isomerase-like protein